jgi:hypothetical protein
VSDQDFNFHPPERREAKKVFEPPPWEQDQFDELARRKEAEKTAAELEAGAASEELPAAEAPEQGSPVAAPLDQAAEPAPASTAVEPAHEAAIEVDDPRIEAMLVGLRREEPPFGTQMWKVALAAGAVLASVGAVLMVWGLFALAAARRAGATSALGGGILVVFGLGFIGVGGWMAYRTLRQQGVL